MSFHTVQFDLPNSDRRTMRRLLIYSMLEEVPGEVGNASRYEYVVEKYDSYEIYLRRPTQLNKGFDFTVNIRGVWFKKRRRYSCPSHEDVFEILTSCKKAYPDQYDKVSDVINDIYYGRSFDLSAPLGIFFSDYEGNQHPIEILLLAIKWLFMEQDCAYWNYSGRRMLYEGLKESNLV